jgi:FKBP-type peptidyl-prolyl cis-trans isomerase SlyD
MTEEFKVAKDHVVAIDYKLHLEDGQLADSTQEGEPLLYLHGRGHMVPGLESALEGKAAGWSGKFRIPPEEAYGPHDPAKIFKESPDRFGFEVKVGTVIQGRLGGGRSFPIQVIAVEPDSVTLDPNHPLAGKTLDFDVKVLAVRPATPEELQHSNSNDEGCGPDQCSCCGHDCGDEGDDE